eukprot:3277162-Amphidinium_carterae.1
MLQRETNLTTSANLHEHVPKQLRYGPYPFSVDALEQGLFQMSFFAQHSLAVRVWHAGSGNLGHRRNQIHEVTEGNAQVRWHRHWWRRRHN